ncbi:SRPBCC family protein [Candidatus Leptofilum sp.]|uniref:SRPBCC family protein n=1 Tax=Candidatus Leptofilum sp. TaxID=3241576 RepID=UPI003B59E9D0
MTTIIKSVEINAPRDVIRKYYAHPVNTPRWSHVLTEWEPEAAWPKTGTTAKMGIKSGGINVKGVATTLAYDEETMTHHWRHENEHSMPPFESWYTFDEVDGKTTVTAKVDYTVPGSFLGKALDKLFVERQNAKDIEQGLLNLKLLAEADPD